jgi:hypothetical protein
MQSALYFAFIRGREGEIQALRALSPLARARMTVVVDLPTMKEGSNKSIEITSIEIAFLTALLTGVPGNSR